MPLYPSLFSMDIFWEDTVEVVWELPITEMVDGSGEGWEDAILTLIEMGA